MSLPPSASQVGGNQREVGSFELRAPGLHDFDVDREHDGRRRFTFDSGAAVATFPSDAKGRRFAADPSASYRTASGEIARDVGGARVEGQSEWSEPIAVKDHIADIRKPLVPASQVDGAGRATRLASTGGYVPPRNFDLIRRVDEVVDEAIRREKSAVPRRVESGAYVGYVKKCDEAAQSDRRV